VKKVKLDVLETALFTARRALAEGEDILENFKRLNANLAERRSKTSEAPSES
jgi:hypothetical protein